MSSSIRIGINSSSAILERCLDIPGYIPSAGAVTGVIRWHLAVVQLVICIAAAAILLFGNIYNKLASRKISEETLGQWFQISEDNWYNGSRNYCRSYMETISFFSLSLIFYDIKKARAYRGLGAHTDFFIDSPQVYSNELNIPLLPFLLLKEKKIQPAGASA